MACTLTDVMSCVPLETPSFELGPRDYLNEFLNLISTLRGGQARYVPLLLGKIDTMLSTMAGPIIPPLIYETTTTDEDRFEDLGAGDLWTEEDRSNSHSLQSLLAPAPPTLSTSSSDMSEFSLIGGSSSGDESFSMVSLAPPYTGGLLTTTTATTANVPQHHQPMDRSHDRRGRRYGQALLPDDEAAGYPVVFDNVVRHDARPRPDYYGSQFG